jgi:hypothetical protein
MLCCYCCAAMAMRSSRAGAEDGARDSSYAMLCVGCYAYARSSLLCYGSAMLCMLCQSVCPTPLLPLPRACICHALLFRSSRHGVASFEGRCPRGRRVGVDRGIRAETSTPQRGGGGISTPRGRSRSRGGEEEGGSASSVASSSVRTLHPSCFGRLLIQRRLARSDSRRWQSCRSRSSRGTSYAERSCASSLLL